MRRRIRPAILSGLLLAVAASVSAAATYEELARQLPIDAEVVLIVPDVDAGYASVQRWANRVLNHAPGEIREQAYGYADIVREACDGAAAFVRTGDEWLVMAGIVVDPVTLIQNLAPGMPVVEEDGILVAGTRGAVHFYIAVRDGLLIVSHKRETLAAYLALPDDKKGPPAVLPILPAQLAGLPPEQFALIFAHMPSAFSLPFEQTEDAARAPGPGMAGVQDAIKRRVMAMASMESWTKDWKGFSVLMSGERFVAIQSCIIPAAADPAGLRLPLPDPGVPVPSPLDAFPLRAWGDGADLGEVVEQLAEAMTRFDEDVGQEFRDEMAELDRDLGFDFAKDFLGRLGPAWALGVRKAEAADAAVEWAFVCGLRDRSALIRHAARIAELGEELWQGLPAEKGLRRFEARTFTVPVLVAFAEETACIASSEAALRDAIAGWPIEKVPPGAMGGQWQAHAVIGLRGLAPFIPKSEFKLPVSRLPEDARLAVHVWRQQERMQAALLLAGLAPEDVDLLLASFLGDE